MLSRKNSCYIGKNKPLVGAPKPHVRILKRPVGASKQFVELAPRLPEEESAQHGANVTELGARLNAQQTNLSGQKSNTSAQDEVVKTVNQRIVSLRKIVTGANAPNEIKKAFALDTRIVLTVGGVASAAETVMEGYKQFTAWCNKAGIIKKDIDELTALEASLYSADNKQEQSKYARKAATMDKNTLQRAVEDGVTKISNLGVHEFELSNAAVAKLFADLIPSSPEKAKKAESKAKTASA